jgi:hypothetical protein
LTFGACPRSKRSPTSSEHLSAMLKDTANDEFRVHPGILCCLGDAIDRARKGAAAPDGDAGKEESMNAKSESAFRPCLIVSIALALAMSSSFPSAARGNHPSSPPLARAELCRFGALQPVATYPTLGAFPESVVMGRFNADAFFDLAVTNSGQLNAGEVVSVFLNNGDGTFAGAVAYITGRSPQGLATDDFNGDSHADLVVTNYNSGDFMHPGNISVLLGNGDGTFQPPAHFDVGYGPTAVATGDFNNDTQRDVAVTNWGTSNSVSVLLGNGNGEHSAWHEQRRFRGGHQRPGGPTTKQRGRRILRRRQRSRSGRDRFRRRICLHPDRQRRRQLRFLRQHHCRGAHSGGHC